MAMKRIGVREFKNKATALIAEEEALIIEKHGKPVGFYIPIKPKDKNSPELKEAIARLDALMEDILARTGMSEDEFVEELTKDWENKQGDDAARR
jgi:antitoxin (DNA-binding transcriptional repressor) of toxin-antitoxin stability system